MSNDEKAIAAIEEEKFVLSAMQIREGECVPVVMAALEPDDFYRPKHRIVYRASLKLYAEGTPPNVLSLKNELQATGNLENVSLEFLYMLTEYAHTTAYVPAYCKIIKEKANLRRLQFAAEKIAQEAAKGILPANEIISAATTEFTAITGAADATKISTFSNYFGDRFLKNVENQGKYADRKTGFDNLDEKQFFSPGLYVLGAIPACGKTTFAWQMLEQLARNGESCIFCSYEMSELELYTKSVARALYEKDPSTTITAAKIRRGNLSPDVIDVAEQFTKSNLPLKVIELQNETVDELLNLLRPMCTGVEKAPVVCIDYLQIIPSDKDVTKLGVDDTVRKLKKFQRDTNTTFLVVSSFNRTNYLAPVSFESFKESGNIEYTADVVWGLQLSIMDKLKEGAIVKNRQAIDEAKKAVPREVQLRCLKNRQGANYDCKFFYYAAHDAFVDADAYDEVPAHIADCKPVPPPVDDSYAFEEDDNEIIK